MTDTIDRFGVLLGELARIWRTRLDQRLKPLRLSQARWLVLLHLSRGGDGMVQKELANRIGIEGPTLVSLLDGMMADGWIVRRESTEDRRSKTVHLTDKAHEVLPRINAAAAQLRHELLAGIPEQELIRCMGILRQIKDRAESVSQAGDTTGDTTGDTAGAAVGT
jgi:MarR family transcriptional regulator, transcriptional regulator for hemolysin